MDCNSCDKCPKGGLWRKQTGLNGASILEFSARNAEPQWMTRFRLDALSTFQDMPMPDLGVEFNLDEMLESEVVPGGENDYGQGPDKVAGVGVHVNTELVYSRLQNKWENQGVIFSQLGAALIKYPKLVRRFFATVVGPENNKFSALNAAMWNCGLFIYVPPGVCVDEPIHGQFMVDGAPVRQFERTLIVVDAGASLQYVEGCGARPMQPESLHCAVTEVVALKGANVRYTTLQNWPKNVCSLITKRAVAYDDAIVEWVDGTFGGKLTVKCPCVELRGARSKAKMISLTVAGEGQHQDVGSKVVHCAPNTSAVITSRSICKNGGKSLYRGGSSVLSGALGVKSRSTCDSLLLGNGSRAEAKPYVMSSEGCADVGHEASVSKVDDKQFAYLATRGIGVDASRDLIINGFSEEFASALPVEYAVELERMMGQHG